MNIDPIIRQHGISELLRRSGARNPDKTALIYGERRRSFAELDAEVDRAASWLASLGIARGERVAMLSRNSDLFVIAYLALARLGAISVPINFMLGPDEIAYILDHSGARAFFVQDALVAVAALAIERANSPEPLRLCAPQPGNEAPQGWQDVRAWESLPDAGQVFVELGDDEPMQLMYTSGTESRPKGAMMTSRSLIAQYVSAIVGGEMSEGDVELHALPLYHCAQLHCFLTPDLYLGATSILLNGPDPAVLLEMIERERVTKLFAPPTIWIAMLRHPDFDRRDLSCLRKAYYGAAIMPVEVLKELGARLPDVRFFNFYGQTEMAPVATILRPEDQARKAGSAGRACLNVETRIVDDEDRIVAAGTVGEIVHRSPHAMLGYWNSPEQTASTFRNGWFHSGDLGVMDEEGYLTVVDRKKDMIKTGGENVASREVEEVLHGHGAIAEAAVFAVPHPYWIEAVVAAVLPRPGQSLVEQEVIAHCRARLAGYKVPKFVVVVDALPKNPSGKILKRELRNLYAELAKAVEADATETSSA